MNDDPGHWAIAVETGPLGTTRAGLPAATGRPLLVGRVGDLRLGAEPRDPGVSRRAVTLEVRDGAWQIEVGNVRAAELYPWGLAGSYLRSGSSRPVEWPLVGVLVGGERSDVEHWLLLESRVDPDDRPTTSSSSGTVTTSPDPPRALTPAESEALWHTFDDFLAWPPRRAREARPLKSVARRLGLTLSGVQARLGSAQRRALDLGLPTRGRLTDPDYLFRLVGAGYLTPPSLETNGTLLRP